MENYLVYLIIFLFVLTLLLFIWVVKLHHRMRKFMQGKNAVDLESFINRQQETLFTLSSDRDTHQRDISKLKQDILRTLQKVGVVRFNPFKDMGGNQSFAIALIDKNNDGLVISALHTRERVNIFAKPIENGSSSFPLSKEEEAAISQAQK